MKVPIANGKYHKSADRVVGVLVFSALAIWFFSFYVFFQYDASRPNRPTPASGQVYAQNNHGHIVYLTRREDSRLTNIRVLSFVLFGLGFGIRALFVENPFRQKAPWEKKQW